MQGSKREREKLLRAFLDRDDTRAAALSICQSVGTTNVERGSKKLDEVDFISLTGRKFHSLEAISLLTNLERLIAKDAHVRDIGGIEQCHKLKLVILAGNPLTDVTPIGQLKKLQNLDLTSTRISNVDALAPLPKLTNLRICRTAISSFDGLAELPLTNLGLWQGNLKTFEQLPGLRSLEEFWLPENPIQSLEGIERFPNLRELDLADCELQSLEGIQNLTKLRSLSISGNQHLNSLAPLFGLKLKEVVADTDLLDRESAEYVRVNKLR